MEQLQNEHLIVTLSAQGAEVQHVQDVATGREYWWHGDSRYWAGRDPKLFPIVGRLWNNTAHMADGSQLTLPKHGFVRDTTWRLVSASATEATYERTGTVADYAIFPFAYRLSVTYRLEGRKLTVSYHVWNTGGAALSFQFGGHPAFVLPDWTEEDHTAGYIELEGHLSHLREVGPSGCVKAERLPLGPLAEGSMPITIERFEREALIFDEGQIAAATLMDKQRRPVVRVSSNAPVWLFWRPVGLNAPFICIEPWYGLCDAEHYEGLFSERPYTQTLPAGDTEGWAGGLVMEFFP